MVIIEKVGTIYEEIIKEIGSLLQCVVSMLRDEDIQDGSEVLLFLKKLFLFNLPYFFNVQLYFKLIDLLTFRICGYMLHSL